MLRAPSTLSILRQLHGLQTHGAAVLRKQCQLSNLSTSASSLRISSSSSNSLASCEIPHHHSTKPLGVSSRTWRLVTPAAGAHHALRRIPTASVHSSATASSRYAAASVDGGNGGGGKQGGGEGGSGGGGGGGGGNEGQSGAGDTGKSSRLWAFWLWYMGCLDSNPIFTKAITSALLTLFGDVFCQFVVDNAEKLDIKRTCIMTLLGFALTGPTLHFWYLSLYKFVTVAGPLGVGVRLALDQFLFSPIFIAVFISSLMTLEGKSSQIVPKLKQDLWEACLANWKLWIPTQTINFMFVPQKLQVGFANIVALAWNTYMSYQSHKKVEVKVIQMEELPIKSG
ncbi:hypothetical protein R1flu_015586 [Riccia fluitans]|uniref:Uncharacterized protein n=1 Tax=Riccia fluitans TaxID=41844 RepID=A0ABD1YJS7_9MARC